MLQKVNSGTPLRQRIVLFIEETILSPIEEYVEALTAEYPETSRIVFRYIQTPIRKVNHYLLLTQHLPFLLLQLKFNLDPRILEQNG
jgi:hypothetical protein